MSTQHAEHCKGYNYKVVGSVDPKLTSQYLADVKEIPQDDFVVPQKTRLRICKCKKCHKEFMLLKIDCGTYSHEEIYRSKLP